MKEMEARLEPLALVMHVHVAAIPSLPKPAHSLLKIMDVSALIIRGDLCAGFLFKTIGIHTENWTGAN